MSWETEMMAVLRSAAQMRGLSTTADEIEGYLGALRGVTPRAALDALAGLWRDEDRRAMPTPAAIRARVAGDARSLAAKAPQLPPPSLGARERAFGLDCADICRSSLAGEIDGAEARRRIAASAKEHGLLPRVAAELDSWAADGGR
jgi:hypothetical protein